MCFLIKTYLKYNEIKKPNSSQLLTALLFLFILAFGPKALAQRTVYKLTYRSFNQVDLGFEFALKSNHSISLNAVFGAKRKWSEERRPGEERSRYESNYIGASTEFRQYLSDFNKALQGLYLGAHASLSRHQLDYTHWIKSSPQRSFLGFPFYPFSSREVTVWGRALGLKLGYQKRWGALTVDLGGGLQHIDTFSENTLIDFGYPSVPPRDYRPDVEGLRWYFSIGVGCSF